MPINRRQEAVLAQLKELFIAERGKLLFINGQATIERQRFTILKLRVNIDRAQKIEPHQCLGEVFRAFAQRNIHSSDE